jgi:hypothetical protein
MKSLFFQRHLDHKGFDDEGNIYGADDDGSGT